MCCLVRNIVSTVNLGIKLNLKDIAMRARNAEYNPKVCAAAPAAAPAAALRCAHILCVVVVWWCALPVAMLVRRSASLR